MMKNNKIVYISRFWALKNCYKVKQFKYSLAEGPGVAREKKEKFFEKIFLKI